MILQRSLASILQESLASQNTCKDLTRTEVVCKTWFENSAGRTPHTNPIWKQPERHHPYTPSCLRPPRALSQSPYRIWGQQELDINQCDYHYNKHNHQSKSHSIGHIQTQDYLNIWIHNTNHIFIYHKNIFLFIIITYKNTYTNMPTLTINTIMFFSSKVKFYYYLNNSIYHRK